jgi:hypothetical protein
VLPVDHNQPHLWAAIALWFSHDPAHSQTDWRVAQQVSKGHGRLEKRTLTASNELGSYCREELGWTTVQQVLRLERCVTKTGMSAPRVEVVYGISSLPSPKADAARLLASWRGHWGIEKRLHWVRDVVMGEDACRVHTGNAPQALAALRNAALSLVRAFGFNSLTQAQHHLRANLPHAISFVCGILE